VFCTQAEQTTIRFWKCGCCVLIGARLVNREFRFRAAFDVATGSTGAKVSKRTKK
jgi:hypothetical protein